MLTGPLAPSAPVTMGQDWGGIEDMDQMEDLGQQNRHHTRGVPAGGEGAVKSGITQTNEGWRLGCEYSTCVWYTPAVPVEQLAALTKMYELHTQQAHAKKDGADIDKDQDAYNEATQLKTIPAHTDNRVDILSPVRFYPLPLRYQHIAKRQPAQQSPVFSRLDLSHLGVHLADSSIVGKLHNRTYTGAQLKHFSGCNLRLDPEDKGLVFKPMSAGGLQQTKNVRQILSMGEAVMALLNCELIMRHLHPCDYGTTAIVRFLLERINHPNMPARITSVATVCNFFQSAFKANADRVLGPDFPRTYQEVSAFFTSMDWTSAVPASDPEALPQLSRKSALKSGDRKGVAGVGGADIRVKGSKVYKFKNQDLCYQFQTKLGCQKVANASGDGCIDGYGNQFIHVCNVAKGGLGCGSTDHGRSGHV